MLNRAKGSSRVWVYLWLPRSRTITVTIGYFCVEVRHCLTETGYICGNTSNMSSPKGMATYTNNCVIYLCCYFFFFLTICQDLSALTVTVRTKWDTTAKYTVKHTKSWPQTKVSKHEFCVLLDRKQICVSYFTKYVLLTRTNVTKWHLYLFVLTLQVRWF